jgi:hypothetical protein
MMLLWHHESSMKRRASIPALSLGAFVLIGLAGLARASCTPPPADFSPMIPDGATASQVEMAIAAEQVDSYVRILTSYIDCTDEQINRIAEDPAQDVDRDEFVAMIEQRTDAVSRRNDVLRDFEYQLHLLEARVEQADELAAGADAAGIVADELAELIEALRALERTLGDETTEPLWRDGEDSPDGELSGD